MFTRTCGGTGADCPEEPEPEAEALALEAAEEDGVRGAERGRAVLAAGPAAGLRFIALGSPEAAIASGLVSTTTVGGADPIAAGKSWVAGAPTCKIPGPET